MGTTDEKETGLSGCIWPLNDRVCVFLCVHCPLGEERKMKMQIRLWQEETYCLVSPYGAPILFLPRAFYSALTVYCLCIPFSIFLSALLLLSFFISTFPSHLMLSVPRYGVKNCQKIVPGKKCTHTTCADKTDKSHRNTGSKQKREAGEHKRQYNQENTSKTNRDYQRLTS